MLVLHLWPPCITCSPAYGRLAECKNLGSMYPQGVVTRVAHKVRPFPVAFVGMGRQAAVRHTQSGAQRASQASSRWQWQRFSHSLSRRRTESSSFVCPTWRWVTMTASVSGVHQPLFWWHAARMYQAGRVVAGRCGAESFMDKACMQTMTLRVYVAEIAAHACGYRRHLLTR